MTNLENKLIRLAPEIDATSLSKGHKPYLPIKDDSGKYQTSWRYFGVKVLARITRSNGEDDIVVCRWDKLNKRYAVVHDENAFEGRVIEFNLIYKNGKEDNIKSEGEAEKDGDSATEPKGDKE